MRISSAADWRAHTDKLFYENKVLKVKDIYSLYLGYLMYQLEKGEAPMAIASIFVKNNHLGRLPYTMCHQLELSLGLIHLHILDQSIGTL